MILTPGKRNADLTTERLKSRILEEMGLECRHEPMGGAGVMNHGIK